MIAWTTGGYDTVADVGFLFYHMSAQKREFTRIQLTGQLTATRSVLAFYCYVLNVFREQKLIFFCLKIS